MQRPPHTSAASLPSSANACTYLYPPYNHPVPNPDLHHILAFLLETDRLKTVTRKIRVANTPDHRLENSAEHSWQLCLFAITLQPFAAAPVDLHHVLEMLLLHDLGEIDTGDTMAFVEGGWAERKHDERAAVRRIFALLPQDRATHFLALWDEFEAGQTPESRFSNAVDRATPPLLNLANHGGSWVEHGITHARVVTRIQTQIEAGAPALWHHLAYQLQQAQDAGWFGTRLDGNTPPPAL